MIAIEELKKVFIEENVYDNIANNILSKKSKELLRRGNINNIKNIIKILKKYDLVHLRNSIILARGKAEEIKNIIEILKDYPGLIEQCPSILAYGKAKEIENIIVVLKNYPKLIEQCPYILAQGKAEEIKNIIEILKDYPELIEQCPSILAYGKVEGIENIIEILKDYPKLIEQCPTILVHGKAEEIKNIIEILENYPKLIEQCPSILAHGKAEEIKNIIEVLENYPKLIEQCPSILAQGKAEEIKNIIEVLKDYPELIEQCPSILARSKAEEIKKIIEILKDYPKLIEQCPSILAQGKAEDIQKSLSILGNRVNNLSYIGSYYLMYPEILEVIMNFSYEKISKLNINKYIKLYLILNEYFNKLHTKEELINISKKMGISLEFLLKNTVIIYNEDLLEYWIGDPIPMTKEQMENNKYFIIDMAKIVSKSFYKIYSSFINNFDDLYDWCQDIIINKCGGVFINCKNSNILQPVLFNYIKKYCLKMLNYSSYTDLDKVAPLERFSLYDNEIEEEFTNKYDFLTSEEMFIFKEISKYIESGYENYIELISDDLNITKEQVLEIIKNIREKIQSSGRIKIYITKK